MAGRRRANSSEGPRDGRFVVRVNPVEQAKLVERAAAHGVTPQALMVASAMSDSIESVTERRRLATELMTLQRMVGKTADNMNQVARKANTTHEIPSDFGQAIREARASWEHLDVVLEQFVELNRQAGA